MADAISEIQKAIADKKQVYGLLVTLKLLKAKKVKIVYLTSNVAKQAQEDIMYYAGLTQTPVEKLSITNEDLAIICKKPFMINVISITA